ncbi:MAG TPA: hypothetical protein VJ201_05125, partial [Candidatus Babeliales bacterium]|nr:hypothetical protein [Candidatus Babeliales bacterium]
MDYIDRDGRETGVVATLDFKFLDRMTITRAALFSQDDGIDLNIKWKEIPETCEHIVFDVYDHKRGFIRDSVITEILACLQARYQLAERVYEHRVVEGARSMLQEISFLLTKAGVLQLDLLHTCNSMTSEKEYGGIKPIGDETFLSWILSIDINSAKEENKKIIKKAKALATCIMNRRIYREAVIIDGIHGYTEGSKAGHEKNCKALAEVLVPDTVQAFTALDSWKEKISFLLKSSYKGEESLPDALVTIGARKWGKRFKLPLVLMATPFKKDGKRLDIQPLFACKDPQHIRIQIDAIKSAYDSLWRVYLFIHPVFHSKEYKFLHGKIEESFIEFVREHTPVGWKNSISVENLLSFDPIDVSEFVDEANRNNKLVKFFDRFISTGKLKLKPVVSQEISRTVHHEEREKFVQKINLSTEEWNYLKYSTNQEWLFSQLNSHTFFEADTTDNKLHENKTTLFDMDDEKNISPRMAAIGNPPSSDDMLVKFFRTQIKTGMEKL